MINNIHSVYLKGEKAFEKGNFSSAKKHLLSVIDCDENYYAAYLLLFEIAGGHPHFSPFHYRPFLTHNVY